MSSPVVLEPLGFFGRSSSTSRNAPVLGSQQFRTNAFNVALHTVYMGQKVRGCDADKAGRPWRSADYRVPLSPGGCWDTSVAQSCAKSREDLFKASSHAWKSHLTVQYGRTGRDPLPSKGCNGAVISPDVRFSGAFLLLLHWRLNGRDPHRQKTLPKCTVSTGHLQAYLGVPCLR